MRYHNIQGLGIVDQIVKGTLEFIAGQVSRPRVAENWAGSGEYEHALLTRLNSGAFPYPRYQFKDPNHPFLVRLYDHYVEYGKRWFPNKRGMAGEGVEFASQARAYISEFIGRCGGEQTFDFLFYDTLYDDEIARLEAEIAQVKQQTQQAQKAKTKQRIAVGGSLAGLGFLAGLGYLAYRYKQRRKAQNTRK